MKLRFLASKLCAVLFAFIADAAEASECISHPMRFDLTSDTVHWSFEIRSGGECLQGLRGKTMLLDEVKLVKAPSAGVVTIAGPSFRYAASLGAPTSDTFTLEVSGENRRQRGSSVIIVDVHAK